MKITEILKRRKPIFSCEFFPPKTDEGMALLFETVRELKALSPGYVSVTYGAGGSTRGKTLEIVQRIKRELGIEAMAHLTCVGHSREELKDVLDQIRASGIDNVIALRGDPPRGEKEFKPHPGGFRYAFELVEFIRKNYGFCLAVAGYPEGHVEAPDKETDWNRLVKKVQAGGEFVITQLFFDNRDFFAFEKAMRAKGLTVPIIPGIMPITNAAQIQRFTQMCGAKIPGKVSEDLARIGEDPEAAAEYGVQIATRQCLELLDRGVPGIHFYTLNKSTATRRIIENLKIAAKVFACALLLALPSGLSAQESASTDPVFAAMREELSRSQKKLKFGAFTPPYFISYQMMDTRETNLVARNGTLTQDQSYHARYLYVQLRYGDYSFDSGGEDDRGFSDSVSLESSTEDIRHRLWLLTDQAYKQAVKDYLQKQGKKIAEVEKEKLDDFSREKPVVSQDKIPPADASELKDYRAVLKGASAAYLKFPHLQEGSISLRLNNKVRYVINSEGTQVLSPGAGNPYFIYVWARTQADDGMNLTISRSFSLNELEKLPSEKALRKTIEEMARTLSELRNAKTADPFTGPAILDPESTGVLFHEAVGHRLEGERQRNEDEGQTFRGQLGKEIIPPHLSVIDDPTASDVDGVALNGRYSIDDEGVRARKVVLVEDGVLRNFLLSRRPVSGFNRSNGHGRAQFGRDPIGRMSNLFVKSTQAHSYETLKKMLLEECLRQKKPYGMIIKRTRSGDTFTGRGRYQAFRGTPEEVVLVDAKTGSESLVRGVEVVGTPLITVNKIIATGKEFEVLNAFCTAESGNVPVSTIAPWSIVQEIELQRVREDKQRPPILAAPAFEAKP